MNITNVKLEEAFPEYQSYTIGFHHAGKRWLVSASNSGVFPRLVQVNGIEGVDVGFGSEEAFQAAETAASEAFRSEFTGFYNGCTFLAFSLVESLGIGGAVSLPEGLYTAAKADLVEAG